MSDPYNYCAEQTNYDRNRIYLGEEPPKNFDEYSNCIENIRAKECDQSQIELWEKDEEKQSILNNISSFTSSVLCLVCVSIIPLVMYDLQSQTSLAQNTIPVIIIVLVISCVTIIWRDQGKDRLKEICAPHKGSCVIL